jgi:putative oxidoreductase
MRSPSASSAEFSSYRRTPRKRGSQRTFEGYEQRCQLHTVELGDPLQRLFSTFPDGWPGFGLLLLRFGAAIALISFGIIDISLPPGESITLVRDLFAAAGGIFLLAGLWTPVVGALIAIDQVWSAFSAYASPQDGQWIHILLAVLTAAVAMLGPGAWSIDARRFGRQRFDLDRTRGR